MKMRKIYKKNAAVFVLIAVFLIAGAAAAALFLHVPLLICSIPVFGFYLYWQILLVKNVRAITEDGTNITGEILCLLLVPFYALYWWYTRGKQVKNAFAQKGYPPACSGVVYLILGIFLLNIVSMAIMQKDFNSLPVNEVKAGYKKRPSKSSNVYFGVIMAFLYLPLIYLIAYSFNDGKTSVWKGFTLKWYTALFNDAQIMGSLRNTLIIALLASVIATVLGTAAAIGIYNFKGGMRSAIRNVSNIPIINPEIVTGVSLMLLFTFAGTLLGFEMGFWTVLLAHIGFCTPYVILNVTPRIKQMDGSLYEAALDLGCSPAQAFFKVVIHELMPGIFSGFLISFTYSLDDFVITYFTRGSRFQTLPVQIYTMTHQRINPKANALSALMFAVVFGALVISNIVSSRKNKEAAR